MAWDAPNPDGFVFQMMEISCRDKITGRDYEQQFFSRLRWSDDAEKWYYEDVGHQERERLEEYLKQYRQPNKKPPDYPDQKAVRHPTD